MADPVVLRCGGLMTDPNPHLTVEMGALRQAVDISLEWPGVATARPGLATFSGATKSSSQRPRAIYGYGSTPFLHTWDGASTYAIETTAATITGNATAIDRTLSWAQFAEARKALHYTSTTGPRVIESEAASASRPSGVDMWYSSTDIGTPSASSPYIDWGINGGRWYFPTSALGTSFTTLAAGDDVEIYRSKISSGGGGVARYVRIVYVKKDGNGYIRRSPPSTNIWLVSAGTPPAPSPELYLSQVVTLTSTDVSNGYFTIPDDLNTDDDLGASLYTAPSQNGLVASKAPPPRALAMAQFAGCMWYGNTVARHRLQGSLRLAQGITGGLQRVNTTGDFAIGTNTITNVVSVTNMIVGMYVTDSLTGSPQGPSVAGTNVPADTTITNITGAGPFTITMSANALATNAGVNIRAGDMITAGGITFYCFNDETPGTSSSMPRCFFNLGSNTPYGMSVGLSWAWNRYGLTAAGAFNWRLEPKGQENLVTGTTGSGDFFIEEMGVGGSSLTLTTTRPAAFTPSLSGSVNAVTSADTNPNRLYWSDQDEPEAVPIGQYVDIGSAKAPILALVPLKTCLLVFKTDGVFKVTGVAPDTWAVDAVDNTLRLLRAECVDKIDDIAVAWTDQGIYEVDETGARSLTAARIDRELAPITYMRAADSATLGYFVRAWQGRRMVLCGGPSAQQSQQVASIYVWHTRTRQWSLWDWDAYCAGDVREAQKFLMARGGAYWELRRAAAPDTLTGYDRTYSISAWTYTAGSTTVTVSDAQRGDWEPKAGDWVAATIGGTVYYRRVTVATDTGTAYDLTIESAFPAGAQSSLASAEGIISKIQWQAVTAGKPSRTKLCNGMHLLLDWTSYTGTVGGSTARWLLGGITDVTTSLETKESTAETRVAKDFDLRVGPPRNLSRHSRIYPYAETCDIGLNWRLNGIALDLEDIDSPRTNR